MTVPLRAALYLRVSTARQAERDVLIPNQNASAKPMRFAPSDFRHRAGGFTRPQSEGHAGTRRERPNPPCRYLLLRRLWRRHDAQDREGRVVSLRHLVDQCAAG